MNAREKFLRTMEFDISVPPPLYEMGWWIGTIRRWYNEGLPKIQGVPEDLPSGESVRGPLLGGKKKCTDPAAVVNFDKGCEQLPLEHWIFPEFKPQVLQFTSFLREMGVKHIIVDTDGNCWELIPLFLWKILFIIETSLKRWLINLRCGRNNSLFFNFNLQTITLSS